MTLLLHGQEIACIFDLLGQKENGLTYALGWVLSKNQEFLKAIIQEVTEQNFTCEEFEIRLQEYQMDDQGYTDIELLVDKKLYIIIEAKIGWNLPKQEQISRYVGRFKEYADYTKKFVVISEHRPEYAIKAIKQLKCKIPIAYLSWHSVNSIIQEISGISSNREKRLAADFQKYFQKVVHAQNLNSNKVFCVVLDNENFDFVSKKNEYHYPLSKRWPRDPPNYIALRYHGRLYSIHHVDSFDIEERPQESPIVKLFLGKPFKPINEVKNGDIYNNGHCWFDLDTVFVCKTIKEAVDLTRKREA